MASHARSTRTPLLPQFGNPRPLLGQGLGRQLGPVTQAIRAMRAGDCCTPTVQHPTSRTVRRVDEDAPKFGAVDHCTPRVQTQADQAIAAIQEGLDHFFAETGIPVTAAELRRRIEDRIEADLELLEALDGDADREPEETEASATEWAGRGAHRFNVGRAA